MAVVCLGLVVGMRLVAGRRIADIEPIAGAAGTRTLVVAVHGMNGAPSRDGMLAIIREEYPDADIIAPLYFESRLGVLSNADAYEQADALEDAIHRLDDQRHYERIVLVGHSMGASLVRKALVWAHGEQSDRPGGARPERAWVTKVERFVSLAGINRGWSIDPRPRNMSPWRAWMLAAGGRVAALTNTARFIEQLRRGAPFVADLRVQWMRVARGARPGHQLPPTVHLLGTQDDIVNSDDSRDLCAATGVRFVTLPNTGHADIAAALVSDRRSPRAQMVRDAIAGRLGSGAFDASGQCTQVPGPRQLVFIVHGIRDYADWGDALKRDIEREARARRITLVVEPPKYGWFPMAPFLLQPDRQEKVRWFMDQYTDALAMYPDAQDIDFIGHSNGTYLLGAAMVRYKTIRIRNAYLAGSVLPQRFPWQRFAPGRIESVRNVVAAEDWVVAIFPRLFEQIAEWAGVERVDGFLDLGAAGFRGFLNLAGGRVRNIKYASGSHGIGVDIRDAGRKQALVNFALTGVDQNVDTAIDRVFGVTPEPDGFLDLASRMSWLIWSGLVLVIGGVGIVLWRFRRWAAVSYALLLLAVLNSI